MKRNEEHLLETAIHAVKTTELTAAELSHAGSQVAARLGLEELGGYSASFAKAGIESCEDVQHLLASYRAGDLRGARSLLVEAHLRECGVCLRRSRSGEQTAALDWSTPVASPRAPRVSAWRPRAFGWALAPAFALLLVSFFLYRAYWQVPPGVRAEVRSIDGPAYSSSSTGERRIAAGDKLSDGEELRLGGGGHAVLGLADGSSVEVNERSVVGVTARGQNMTLSLGDGAVIVQAAKRSSGHLYVKTPDCRVAVTGTLFSVSSGIKGSRVAVLQGAVQMVHAGMTTMVPAGNQLATYEDANAAPAREQIAEQISWSHDRSKYLQLVTQFATLEQRIGAIPFPQARYGSDLLARVPAETLLYVSVPNLGDFLSQAKTIFHDQLTQSAALRQWWSSGQDHNTAELDSMVDRLHEMSQYLGDEVVIVGLNQGGAGGANRPKFAIVADVQKSGLDQLLHSRFAASSSSAGVTVLNEASLATAALQPSGERGEYALVRPQEVVFADSIATLKLMNAQLTAGASGFADGDFGRQITAAYGRGAGVILAADVHQMFAGLEASGDGMIEKSGMDGVRYLIAEHRESAGVPENHLNLQFSGTRQRIASWLAAPGPIGSLDFVTPNAAFVAAALSKDPKAIADDIIAMTASQADGPNSRSAEAEQLLDTVRDDLAANLGGDFLLSLDGPVLPSPSWKAVIEVRDSALLEQTLEQLAQMVRENAQGKDFHGIAIQSSESGGQRFYAVQDVTTGTTVADYTFADGYMILAANRPLLFAALRAHSSGDSLARSAAFKALLPKDGNENYSAVAYQNLSSVLTPLLSQLSGEQAAALQQLAADSKPTAMCAWGSDSRIEAASDSRLFGFDFLTLGSFLNSYTGTGNKLTGAGVRD